MRDLRVQWLHSYTDEPVELYSELDASSREIRKVEVFADGSLRFAGPGESRGTTWLSPEPLPPIKEIAHDRQFRPSLIDRAEFERIWRAARQEDRSTAERF